MPDDAAWGPPQGLFVITSDYSTGSFSIVDPLTMQAYNDVGLRRVHYDAFARYFKIMPDYVYVVNRLMGDNIQVLDRTDNYGTVAQESTDQGSNPQDIAVVSDTVAYVTRYNKKALWIVNPAT
ncbi:MAG TPA: hypothetical protein P5346_16055, partial [Spirochaetota bacterium]|nr:hypothetical protein [Spirochaetota bacterium]